MSIEKEYIPSIVALAIVSFLLFQPFATTLAVTYEGQQGGEIEIEQQPKQDLTGIFQDQTHEKDKIRRPNHRTRQKFRMQTSSGTATVGIPTSPRRSSHQQLKQEVNLVDTNNNKLKDRILDETMQKLQANGSTDKLLEIRVVLYEQANLEEAINTFKRTGGTITNRWNFINSFQGKLQASHINDLKTKLGDNLAIIEPTWGTKIVSHADMAPRLTGARNRVWDDLGYNGTQNMSIALMDTGVDPSHPMLAGYKDAATNPDVWGDPNTKVVAYYNGTVTEPRDTGGHGSHTSSIAAGNFYGSDPDGDGDIDVTTSKDAVYYVSSLTWPWKKRVNATGDLTVNWEGSGDFANFTVAYPNDTTAFFTTSSSGTQTFTVDSSTVNKTWGFNMSWDSGGSSVDVVGSLHWELPGYTPNDGNPRYSGVAPNNKIVMVDIFGSDGLTDPVDGFEWIYNNAEEYNILVQSNSWGYTFPQRVPSVDQAVRKLIDKGIIVTHSAGNYGTDYPHQTSSPTSDEVITVASSGVKYPERASYSAVGPGNMNSSTPDIMAPGGVAAWDERWEGDGQYIAADSNDAEAYGSEESNSTTGLQGTSMAAPHVAGVASLMAEVIGGYGAWISNHSDLEWINDMGGTGFNDSSSPYNPYIRNQSYSTIIRRFMLATAWETNKTGLFSPEPHYNETAPQTNSMDDHWEGWGFLQADAAIDALQYEYEPCNSVNSTLYGQGGDARYQPHVWARRVNMTSAYAGETLEFNLTVPSGTDFDIMLFKPFSGPYGEPIVAASSRTFFDYNESMTFSVPPGETGWYILAVKSWYGTGEFSLTSTVLSDDRAPSIRIDAPGSATFWKNATRSVTWTAWDQFLDSYQLTLTNLTTGQDVATKTIELEDEYWKQTMSHTFTNLVTGHYNVTVEVRDLGCNTASYWVDFYIDLQSPEVSITAPSSGTTVDTSAVTVEWQGSDEGGGITMYSVKIVDGIYSGWRLVGKNTSYELTGLDDGTYTVKVKAVDRVGHTDTKEISFTVNTSPILGPGWQEELIIGGIGLLVVIAIAVYIIRK